MAGRTREVEQQQREQGLSPAVAADAARAAVADWVKAREAELAVRYERELMNPNEALSLGSISQIVMPSDLRQVLAENMAFHLRHYDPSPMSGVQREFH
jgi:acetyl-CoA carboxylase carboxyltransferase component